MIVQVMEKRRKKKNRITPYSLPKKFSDYMCTYVMLNLMKVMRQLESILNEQSRLKHHSDHKNKWIEFTLFLVKFLLISFFLHSFFFGPKKHMAQNKTPDFMWTTLTLDIINSTFHKIHLVMCEKPQYAISSKYRVQFQLHRLLYAIIEHGMNVEATWNRFLASYIHILCQSCSRLLSFSLK